MVRKKKVRKTRITKKNIIAYREAKKQDGNKKTTRPGPWSDINTDIEVIATLKKSNGILGGVVSGSYIKDEQWSEKGWYPIYINITSDNIKSEVEKYGIDTYLASCEKSLNNKSNKSIIGSIVILDIVSDNTLHNDSDSVFISCRAKTNKKSIKGFYAMRKNEYKIL